MDNRKRRLKEQYKQRKVVGGVFRVVNRETGRFLLQASDDLRGSRNSFDFSVATGSCFLLQIQKEWKELGPAAFDFQIVEELEQKEEQTRKEFMDDVQALLELCREQAGTSLSY